MRNLLPALLLLAACGGDDASGGPDAAPVVNWNIEGTLQGQTEVVLNLRITDVNGTPVIDSHDDVECDPVHEIGAQEWQLGCSSGDGSEHLIVEVADVGGVLAGRADVDLEGVGTDVFDVTVEVEEP